MKTNDSLIIGLLGVLFVALKLLGYITWSWLWVTLPFWGGFAVLAAIVLVYGIFAAVIYLLKKRGV